VTVCKEHPSSGLSFTSRTRMRPRPRCVDWLRTAQGMCEFRPLQPVSVMCAHYQLAGDEQIAFNPAAQQTFSPTRGCSRMLPLNPSGAVLPLPVRGGPFSLDTSITSRRRGEPADPASVATIRVTGNPPYSNPSCSSRHGTREQLGAVIVMVGTVGRAGFLRTGNGRSFRSVGFPRGREL
jgi:hypothetical protein